MINITQKGSFKNSERYLSRLQSKQFTKVLEKYGQIGVNVLASATPVDSGETANSWSYSIVQRKGYFSIRWYNSHREDGVPIAIILQYGHGTRTGGYVEGRDYINPAMRPLFDQILAEAMKEVTTV